MFVSSLICTLALWQGKAPVIYFVRNDSIYRSTQGRETVVVKRGVGPAISPDGSRLAFLKDGDLYLLDINKGETRRASHLNEKPDDIPEHDPFPSWDPTGRYVIFSHPDRYGLVKRGDETHAMYGSEKATKTIWNVYWSWSRKGTTKTELSLFLGNETTGISSFSVTSSSAASFSPDGKRVAFCRNGDLWMASLDPSTIHDAIREASWDEARVLTCGTQEGGTRATNETSTILRISWSPDGKLLALSSDRYMSSGSAQVIVVRADRPTEKVASFSGTDACFYDAGHLLYVKPYGQSQDIWLRDIETRDEKILIPHATEPEVAR